jgi:hypothetical protein
VRMCFVNFMLFGFVVVVCSADKAECGGDNERAGEGE